MTDNNFEGRQDRAPEPIQSQIERERAVQRQDVKAIGEKFTPGQIKENAKGVLSDAKEEGATMMRDAKDAAVGSLRSTRERAVDAVGDAAHGLSDRARQVGEIAGDYAHRAGDYAQRAGSYARQAGGSTAEFVTANAIPLSLIGIGVGWLAMSLRRQSQIEYRPTPRDDFNDEDYLWNDDYYSSSDEYAARGRGGQSRFSGLVEGARERANTLTGAARERAGGIAESARHLADNARDRAGVLAERAGETVESARARVAETASRLSNQASELSHEARERLQRAQVRGRDFAEENPLAVGAIAIAAGVGVGLLLPTTQPENRLMGQTRDRLVGDARAIIDEAREAGGRVGQRAREAAQEVRSTVSERISH